jgi:dUTP pyrophosphatase
MFKGIKEIREQLKTIKDLQSHLGEIDMNNPEEFLKKMGLSTDDLNKHFESMNDEYSTQITKATLKFVNTSDNVNPSYVYPSDSGFDLRASEEVVIGANSRALVPTGIRLDIADSYEVQIRSKSGLALNQGLFVLNSPGTIDSGYQGEIKVILFNTTNQSIKIEKGQKVAQAVLCPVLNGNWVDLVEVKDIESKDRNDNGFGSTGIS